LSSKGYNSPVFTNQTIKENLKMANQNAVNFTQDMINKYPELILLTGSANATPEATVIPSSESSIGQVLFPGLTKEGLIEFDRTVLGLLALHWVLENDFDSFTSCQKGKDKLSPEQFEILRNFTRGVLSSKERVEAMETYLVINDLGKLESIVKMMEQKTGFSSVDHDLILAKALQECPEVSPSFQRLSGDLQQEILQAIISAFNLGQFVQGENVAASLFALNGMEYKSYLLFAVHSLFDTAGAAGHAVQNGSIIFNEPTVANYLLAIDVIEEVAYCRKGQISNAYAIYLDKRLMKFGINNSFQSRENWRKLQAITRLCCQMRINDSSGARTLLEVFDGLPRNTQAILINELNRTGIDDGWAILIYYAPSMMLNLMQSLKEQPYQQRVSFALNMLARLYQNARMSLIGRSGNGIFMVMAKDIASVAAKNPVSLEVADFQIRMISDCDAMAEVIEVPIVKAENFSKVSDLSELIKCNSVAFIGIGGGSDCIQAAVLGTLACVSMDKTEVTAIISIRTQITQSQDSAGMQGVDRTVEDYERILLPGVYKLKLESTGSGRFLENLPAQLLPTYLVVESTEVSLVDQLQAVLDECKVTTLVAVDTGGDALYQTHVVQGHKATPDQDIRSLHAINLLKCPQKLSCEIAVGVDSPMNAEEILIKAEAVCYEVPRDLASIALSLYKKWDFTGDNDERYGKTALAWQMAMKEKYGWTALDLPTRVVLDKARPWMPFVLIQPVMANVFFMEVEKHLQAIEA
jgi:hypothetical protein